LSTDSRSARKQQKCAKNAVDNFFLPKGFARWCTNIGVKKSSPTTVLWSRYSGIRNPKISPVDNKIEAAKKCKRIRSICSPRATQKMFLFACFKFLCFLLICWRDERDVRAKCEKFWKSCCCVLFLGLTHHSDQDSREGGDAPLLRKDLGCLGRQRRAAKNPGILTHATQIACVLFSRAAEFSNLPNATQIDCILFSRATKTL
jgi:hypothetical protein